MGPEKSWNSDNERFEYQENDDVDSWKIATLILSAINKDDKGDYTCMLKTTAGKRARIEKKTTKSSLRL